MYLSVVVFFFFKQKTAYEMRISDWSSDVCSSDLAAGARADVVQCLFHRRDDLGMLTHRQIVVRAPDGDRLRSVVTREAACVGEGALVAQDVDEDAVATFLMEAVDGPGENIVVVHYAAPRVVPACAAPSGGGVGRGRSEEH